MDANLLKLYSALQPFFRERMGGWQPGDRCCDQQGNLGLVIVPPPHCKDKKVVWVMWFEKNGSFAYQDGYEANDPEIYYLPRTIDDSSPEAQKRSLWGMVDWNRWKTPRNHIFQAVNS